MAYWVERLTSKKGYMVLHREGHGKFSSPHSIKYFGNQNPLKFESYDQNWDNIVFLIHVNSFRMEILKESTCRVILTNDISLENFKWKNLGLFYKK